MSAAAAAAAALRVRVTWRDQMLAAPKQTSWDRGFCLKPPVNGTLVVQLLNRQMPAAAASAEEERHCRGGFHSSSNSSISSGSSSSSSTADPAQSSGQCSAEQRVAAAEPTQCTCDCDCAGAAAAGADIVLQVSRGLHLSTYDAQTLCDTLNSPAKAAAAGTAAWLAAGFRLSWDPEKRRFAVYNVLLAAAFVLKAQRSSMATQLLGFSERDHLSALSDVPLPLLYTSDDAAAAAAVGDTAQQQQQQQQQQCERRHCVYSDELPRPCAQPQWQECVWGPPALDLLQQGGKLTVEVWGVKPIATASATAAAPTAESTYSDNTAATAGADAAVQAVHAGSPVSDTTAAGAATEPAPAAAATTATAVTTAATAAAAAVAAAAPRLAIFAPRAARERLLGRAVLNVPQLCSLATGQQLALPMLTCQRPAATWRSRRRASATSSTLTQDWLVNSVRGSSSAEPDEQSSAAVAAVVAAVAASCDGASSDGIHESELAAAQQQQGLLLERSDRSTNGATSATTAAAAASLDSSQTQQQRQQQQQPAVGTVLCTLRLRDQSQLLVQVLQRWTLRRDEKAAAERRAAHATGICCYRCLIHLCILCGCSAVLTLLL
jgi:hypothetical protein